MSAHAAIADTSNMRNRVFTPWTSTHSYLLLTVMTLACLLPFSGRAFHVDDPLFIWSGQQILKHPLDPYGFHLVWDNYSEPMSEITKNPPLACYYAAAIGWLAGWSERALHLGFLLPAIALVLGTYRLATRFTQSPLLAATATLLTPAVLVSASSVMCDTMMLAFWIWSAIFWIEGLENGNVAKLFSGSLLLGLAALTKYFGLALLPLLIVYSIARKRRAGWWLLYFLLPVAMLAAYQLWTAILYGHAMLSDAMEFAESQRVINGKVPPLASAIVGLSFAGGCTLSVLCLCPSLWKWKKTIAGFVISALISFALIKGWIAMGHYAELVVRPALRQHWMAIGLQLALEIAGGLAILGLVFGDLRTSRDSASLLLNLWVAGTLVFASFVNWTVNARSILPLIPAAGILLARRIDRLSFSKTRIHRKVILGLILSGVVSIWLADADAELANSARQAAMLVRQYTKGEGGAVWFQGHWGFQFYMRLIGAYPVDYLATTMQPGDALIVPENNTDAFNLPSPMFVASSELLEIPLGQPLFTMRWRSGAAFYASFYGPLPFAFGPFEAERYYILRLKLPLARRLVRRHTNSSEVQN